MHIEKPEPKQTRLFSYKMCLPSWTSLTEMVTKGKYAAHVIIILFELLLLGLSAFMWFIGE